jgi:glutamyl-tRNA reductase
LTKPQYSIKIVDSIVLGLKFLYCISISYKSADVELRKKLAFDKSACKKISDELKLLDTNCQCVVLCTCNRTELYYCGEKSLQSKALAVLANYAEISESLLSKHILFFCGDNAIFHLFKVACGIDSMVIGEDEILGQAKTAYLSAMENGTVSYELNMIFQSAFACAKKIKTETALSKTSVSVTTLASNETAKFAENVNALVIGASGKVGTTVLKNLASHKNVSVKATLRHHNSSFKFIEDMGIEVVDYKDRYNYIKEADCIISATSSPHYTITLYDLKEHIIDSKKRLFIDLAVPPDIDPSIAELKNVELINIDYFEQLAKDNNALKLDSVDVANQIIEQEIDVLKKDMLFHSFLPSLDNVKKCLADKPIEEFIYRMKRDASADSFTAFIEVLKTFDKQE